jgi:hypothetical protein
MTVPSTLGENGYGVQIRQAAQVWHVEIVDGTGAIVSERTCDDGSQARTFASTVRQHIYWLSAERFRQYYRI